MKHFRSLINSPSPRLRCRAKCSPIFSTAIFLSAAPLVHAAGSVNLLLPASQNIDYKGKTGELEDESSFGIIFDWNLSGPGSLAINLYALGEYEEAIGENSEYTYVAELSDDYSALFIGYRHAINLLSIGAGFASIRNTRSYTEDRIPKASGNAGSTKLKIRYETALTPALILGYRYAWPSGFTLGRHIFYSFPTDLDIEEGCLNNICISLPPDPDLTIEDLSLTMMGLSLSYSWK